MCNLATTSISIEDIRAVLQQPLPGQMAQERMAPRPPRGGNDRWDRPADCREAGVLLLLYPHYGRNGCELHLTLMQRPDYPGVHGGQISLPGGKREPNETIEMTALREAREEVGVPPEQLQILGTLSSLYIPPSHFCLFPFVACTPRRPTFRPDPIEVAQIIEVPLSLLLDRAIIREETWDFGEYGERLVPYFDVFGHQVWGATAMVLSEFINLLETVKV